MGSHSRQNMIFVVKITTHESPTTSGITPSAYTNTVIPFLTM